MRAGTACAAAMLLALAAPAATAAGSGGHGGHEAGGEPVPTGAALAARCAEYAETLAFTRAQLKQRNVLGRWNLLRSAHRERERFHDEHCRADGGGHGGRGTPDH